MNAPVHAPNPWYSVVDGELVVGGRRISELAREVGRTPFYAYDSSIIDQRVAQLRAALPPAIHLHYAMKANPMPALVAHVAKLVDGLDVASSGELSVALASGSDPAETSFAGPGKRDDELEDAANAGILINVESPREIRVLADIATRTGKAPRVAVRVNPDFELKSSGMKMGGGPKQFGIDAEAVPDALRAIGNAKLQFEGFHIFSGSQNLRAESICEAQSKSIELAIRLSQDAPAKVRSVNIGGGFGIPYFPGEMPLNLVPIGQHLGGLLSEAANTLPDAKLIIELGRYIVGEAGIYVCQVIDRKVSRGQVFLVTDGGLHHHLAASGNFGQVIRKNYPVVIGNRVNSSRREIASIVGPLCTPLDLLADRMDLVEAHEGDLVVVFQSGAYGLSASPLRFLSHGEPLEVLI
jgi:diaminopimelate decarboxylase